MNQSQIKYALRNTFKRVGLDVRPAAQVHDLMDFIRNRKIDTVLDVGANIGQFGGSLRLQGYKGKIISFEPVRSVFEVLSGRAKADGSWEAHHCGLGATNGEATINVSEFSVFSSMLPATQAAKAFDSRSAVERTETVQIKTLDDMASGIQGNILLKIDTQGFERYVIEGGKKTLPRLKGIQMELPIVHLYEGNWQLHEALEYMASLSFVPAQINASNYDSRDPVSLLEVDCLFRPKS